MIEGVIFDMDGVLADTEGFYAQRRQDFFQRMDFYPAYRGSFVGSNEREIWNLLVPEDPVFREELLQGYRAYRKLHPTPYEALLDPEVPELFRTLKERGLKIGIASSSPHRTVEHLTVLAGVADLVDFILSGEECTAHKPAPEIYLRSMQALGLTPQTAIAVEDSPAGIRSALDAGLTVYALRPRHGEEMDQSQARGILDRLSQVLEVL